MNNGRRWRIAAALAVSLMGCDGDTPEVAGGEEAGCVSDLEFFQQSISLPILEADCVNCHNATGIAKDSMLVLAGAGETNYLQRNFEVLAEVAAFERDGQSILLSMPSGQLTHGGGTRFEPGSEGYTAFEQLLGRFAEPVTCDAVFNGGTLDKAVLRDLPGTLRKVKMQLVGELPTAEELEQVSTEGEPALERLLAEYMTRDAFYDTLVMWWNDEVLTDKYLGGNAATDLLDADIYPTRHYYRELDGETEMGALAQRWANRSVAREPLELIAHVVRNDRPFSEILTADYMLLNPFSAPVYGFDTSGFTDASDPKEYREFKLDGVPHAGVMTSPMFLNRYPTTDTNRNRHRSRTVYRLFLATDILAKANRPVDSGSIADHNPTLNNPQCTVCHTSMDPVAGAFQNWDTRGRFVPPEEGWYPDMLPPGFEDPMPSADYTGSLQWLAGQMVRDERFALSAVYSVFTGLVGRPPLANPQDQTDPRFEARLAFYNDEQAFLRGVTDAFVASNHNLKSVVPLIVVSPFYRALSAEGLDDAEQVVLEPLGTARMLTPEDLNAKLIATLGRPWKYRQRDRNGLLHRDEFLFFYGGMDSNTVTKRIAEPNGMMANIAMRMANDMACMVSAADFVGEASERKLFPLVELSYRPEDDNGFAVPQAETAIRANIRYLHQRLLGEVLTPNHAEEDATFELFLATWREGYAALRNDQVSVNLPGRCRGTWDYDADEEFPEDVRIIRDDEYTIRAWQAVVTYLLADWRFIYNH
jgi:hypothetical protein